MAQFADSSAFSKLTQALAADGFAYPNRYEVMVFGPAGGDTRILSLRCESVTLPGRNLASATDTNIYGPTREIVEGVTFAEDVSMTFQSSPGLKERVFFENWQKLAFNEKTWNVSYYEDYVGSVEIFLLDRQDKKQYGLKLHEAYPKTIGGTELSYATNNEIVRITIGFSFRYWTNLDGEQDAKMPERSAGTNSMIDPDEFGAVEKSIARNQPAVVSLQSGQSGPGIPDTSLEA